MIPLRYSTDSQEVALGPFLDSVDGNTEETGLAIANTDIKLWKGGASALVDKHSGGATHMANGVYYATLDATDTDTIGPLVIFVHVSGALAVRVPCIVYPQEVYDYMYSPAGTDYMKVDIAQVDGAALSTHAAGQVPADTRSVAGAQQTARDLGAQLDAQVSTRAPAATALSNAVWTDARAGYLDVLNGIVDSIWNALTSGMTMAGSIGKKLADWVVGTIDTYIGNTPQSGDAFARLGAPAGASVSADIAAVKGDTGAILEDTGTSGVVVADGSKTGYSLANGAIGPLTFATGAIDAAALDSSADSEIAQAILDENNGVETNITLRQALRLMLSALAAKLSGAGTTTITIRDVNDIKTRIIATVDSEGNRTSVSLDAS